MAVKLALAVGGAVALLTLGACATASFATTAAERKETAQEHADSLKPFIRVYSPAGAGPFPAVLQVHGCGGAKPIQDDYAKALAAAGIMGVIIDSFGPRGIGEEEALNRVCTGWKLRGRERSADVVSGLEIVRGLPNVDPNRIGLAGWSHGGWAIMDLLAMDLPRQKPPYLATVPNDVFAGVQGIYLIYPYSSFPSLTRGRGWSTTDIEAHVLIVENDSLANTQDIVNSIEKARRSGARITTETWTGVTHAFEEDDHEPGSGLRYNPEKAAESYKAYVDWFADKLGVAPAATDSAGAPASP